MLLKPRQQLARSPGRVLSAQLAQPLGNPGLGLPRTMLRRSRPILQTFHTLPTETIGPLVAGLAADPVFLAQLRHLIQAALEIGNEPDSTHLDGLAPGHPGIPLPYPNTSSRNCHPCLRSNLLPMSPVCTDPHPLAPSPTRTHARPGEGERKTCLAAKKRVQAGGGAPLPGEGSADGRGD